MFWIFLLAHFIGDYPLQTDKMVVAKHHWRGLLAHVGVHFAILMVLSLPSLRAWFPYILLLSAIHFGIDIFKNWLGKRFSSRVLLFYFQDQLLHFLSIVFVTYVAGQFADKLKKTFRH